MENHEHNHNNSHSHGHSHHHHHHESNENIKVAFFLNLAFSIIELIGGFLTNSIAILSDALHDFGDSFSLALAWYFEKVSKKKRDAKYSYGYRRFSLLGAFINSIVLLAGSVFVIVSSIERLANPQQADAKGMLLLAVIGIAINGIAMLRLRKGSSINERTVSLHLLEDVLGWAAVLVGSIVMIFVDVPILDPIMSLGIACFILYNIYGNVKDALHIVLQGTPDDISYEDVEESLSHINGIKSIHDLHLWTMDGKYNILSIHIVIAKDYTAEQIIALKHNIKEELAEMHIQHITMEIEYETEECNLVKDCC
ncbi:MAG: cation diffusion facilitator family transporter [Ignavibacteria bacterium]|jgi:cobalt-zinc-cadmium efflux system protein|nr:cation diffusion facilitator family transporter [Ignavibacteria bacterium]